MVADDILLLKLIQSKDEHAFKYLFDMYFVPLCRYAHLYLNNTQEGEELVLDIYMYLWEHGNQINRVFSLMFRKTSFKTPKILIKTRA